MSTMAKRCPLCARKAHVGGTGLVLKPCKNPTCPKGAPVLIRHDAHYCSAACRKAHGAVLKAERAAERRANQPKPTPNIYRANCRFCGADIQSGRSQLGRGVQGAVCARRECQNACAREWMQRKALIERGPLPAEKECKHCGRTFMPTCRKERNYCSPKCCAAASGFLNYRKKARLLGVLYEPVHAQKVFERDHWTCQHCGKHTPHSRRGAAWYPNKPELDHVLPMNRRWLGAHTYSNTQCLCAICNGRKGGIENGCLEDLWAAEPRLRGLDEPFGAFRGVGCPTAFVPKVAPQPQPPYTDATAGEPVPTPGALGVAQDAMKKRWERARLGGRPRRVSYLACQGGAR